MSKGTLHSSWANEVMRRRDALRGGAAMGLAWVSAMVFPRPASAAQDLLVMDFTGYEVPDLHRSYIKQYGTSPAFSLFGDGDEAFLKVRAGFRADLVHAGTFDVSRFRDAGLAQPWDTTRLRFGQMYCRSLRAQEAPEHDGQQWLIPADWGINSVLYRTDLVDIKEESWNLLWDKRYTGKLAYGTEMYPAIAGAALAAGVADPYHASDEEFKRIRAKLTEQRPLLRFYLVRPDTARTGGRVRRGRRGLGMVGIVLDPQGAGHSRQVHAAEGGCDELGRRLCAAEEFSWQGAKCLRLRGLLAGSRER